MNIQQAIAANPTATDAEILAIVNAPIAKLIDVSAVRVICLASGTLIALRQVMQGSDQQKVVAALTADDLYRGGIQYIDVGERHDQFIAMLSVLSADLPSGVQQSLTALAFDVPTYTEQQVATERVRIAANATRARIDQHRDSMYALVMAHINAGEPMPTTAELAAVVVDPPPDDPNAEPPPGFGGN